MGSTYERRPGVRHASGAPREVPQELREDARRRAAERVRRASYSQGEPEQGRSALDQLTVEDRRRLGLD